MASDARSIRSVRSLEENDKSRKRALKIDTMEVDEASSLLGSSTEWPRSYKTAPVTPRSTALPRLSRHQSTGSPSLTRINRTPSFAARLSRALGQYEESPEGYIVADQAFHKQWYDQFTSTDWVNDSVKEAFRIKGLRAKKGFRGRLLRMYDASQGWILVAIVGILTAGMAFFVDVTEVVLYDLKDGYCTSGWYFNRRKCCLAADSNEECSLWHRWASVEQKSGLIKDYSIFIAFTILFAVTSSLLTMTTRTALPTSVQIASLDEDLGAHRSGSVEQKRPLDEKAPQLKQYYTASGSGVAEVKVILSGFVLHGYLGIKTLVIKTVGLILSVASGMSLGKEGPYVHIATCIGNICCRIFPKYNHNDAKRREVLSASAAAGVAVAFGAPLGGVLFSLEEVSYYFPPKTLFRTFFCCIVAALSLKFLDPYGTSKIVLFEVRYESRWHGFEIVIFTILGVVGGLFGAFFIKASRLWALTFRKTKLIKSHPVLEVLIVAVITGLISYWNQYTKLSVTELLFELSKPCSRNPTDDWGLCPGKEDIPKTIKDLGIALAIKTFLTIITFGTRVPAGVYVPTMVIGGLIGHMVGLSFQLFHLEFPDLFLFSSCPKEGSFPCIVPGVYALVTAGAAMCGVTRLSVTLVVILFELTGSLDYVLPFSLAVLVSKWVADAVEPLSIYDLLTDLNGYPYLDAKITPIFTSELADIVSHLPTLRIIDLSDSPLVPAVDLRRKLQSLQASGELDGGLPLLKDGILVGLIPAPDLEFALDSLENEDSDLCLMISADSPHDFGSDDGAKALTDFTPYVDPAPVSLEIRSPMELVHDLFHKLGLRYLCILQDGQFAGMVHKKDFLKHLKGLEHE